MITKMNFYYVLKSSATYQLYYKVNMGSTYYAMTTTVYELYSLYHIRDFIKYSTSRCKQDS